jgi:predicted nucleic-acid-binding Zn-ribbon protein
MQNSGKCAKCGSSSLIEGVRVLRGEDQDVNLRVDAHPDAHFFFFKAATRTPLHALVCGQCGFTELYAADSAALVEAKRRQAENS